MKYRPVILKFPKCLKVSPKISPDFYLLYEQAILLALKEQGMLPDTQYQQCLEILTGSHREPLPSSMDPENGV